MSASTEKALAASLKKLLARKTLNKITVRDITDDCGVNRQTFYYHFQDVYDLVEWIFTQEAEKYIGEELNLTNWRETVEAIMADLTEDKSFVMNTYYSLTRRQLDQFMQKLLRPAVGRLLRQSAEGMTLSEEDLSFVEDTYTYALVGIITEWIAQGMPKIDEIRMDRLFRTMEGSMEYVVQRFQSDQT